MFNPFTAILASAFLGLSGVALVSANATPAMVSTPVGLSRIETVRFCLNEAGVDGVSDLITDTEVEKYTSCLIENT